MTPTEEQFFASFKNKVDIICQPRILRHGIIFYTPDFLDTSCNWYYEVITSRQAYDHHFNAGHFDYVLRMRRELIIAVYIHYFKCFLTINYVPGFKLKHINEEIRRMIRGK